MKKDIAFLIIFVIAFFGISCEISKPITQTFGIFNADTYNGKTCYVEFFQNYNSDTGVLSGIAGHGSFTINLGTGQCDILDETESVAIYNSMITRYNVRLYIDVDNSGTFTSGDWYTVDYDYCVIHQEPQMYDFNFCFFLEP